MNFIERSYTYSRRSCTIFLYCFILLVMLKKSECHHSRTGQHDASTHPQYGDLSHRNVTRQNNPIKAYPWHAEVYYRNKEKKKIRVCSAALISKEAILTAAHCIQGIRIEHLFVKFKLGKHLKYIKVKNITPFGYVSDSHVNDIVLLFMNQPIRIVPGKRHPIKLDHDSLDVDYGDTAYFKSESGIYKNGTVELVQLSDCWLFYPGEMLCGQIMSSEICYGDSGGMLWIIIDGEELAIGITSYGKTNECSKSGENVVFTKIKDYNIPRLIEA